MSLRLRLVLWCGVLAGGVVLLCGVMIYALHARAQYNRVDRLLLQTTNGIDPQVQGTPAGGSVLTVLAPTADVVARVYDGAGVIVASTPNDPTAPLIDPRALTINPAQSPTGQAAAQRQTSSTRGTFGIVRGAGGTRWRAYIVPLAGGERYLVAAASLGRIDASADDLRRLVPVVSLLGAGLSMALGWLMIGGALRPLVALTQTAATLAGTHAHDHRGPPRGDGDEVDQLATTFRAMDASVQRAATTQQRFIADASHELRAPLTAIQANLELLERQPTMPADERQQAVIEAGREAQRLARLVADLLTLARADADTPLRRQPVQLDRLAAEAVAEARHMAPNTRLRVGSVHAVVVCGDRDRLNQLLRALLDNAIAATAAGGEITLDVRRADGSALITIRDTGVGIAAEHLPHVFDRFYRADPARARDTGGTGLGLPIARWIARQHGGDLTLTSALGRGTEASVRLPLRV